MEDVIATVCYFCDDCEPPTWHRIHYWCYDDGTYTECDDDGNHDPCDPEDIPTAEEIDKYWLDYSKWVLEHGEDPLNEFYVKSTEQHGFEAALYDVPDGIAVRSIRRTTDPKLRYTPAKAPLSVRRYLGLTKKGKVWLIENTGCGNCGRPEDEHAEGKCLFAASRYEPPNVRQLSKRTEHTRLGNKRAWHKFSMEVPRPLIEYKQELRAAARKHIRSHEEQQAKARLPQEDALSA
jgi:hypothetical protein